MLGDNRTSDDSEEGETLFPGEIEDFQEDDRILVSQEIQNKDAVNDLAGLAQKLDETKLTIPGESFVPWIETCVINVPKIDSAGLQITDELELEKRFYNSARAGVLAAFAKMRELDIPRDRPEDYFAEMIKSDKQMERVKKALLKETKSITDKQIRTKKRIESKFMKTAQKNAEEQKTKARKEETDALRKWRKLRKRNQVTDDDVPEELFDPDSQLRKQLAGYKRGRISDGNSRKDRGRSASGGRGGKNTRGRSSSGGGNFSRGKEGGKDRGRSASSGKGDTPSTGKSFSRKGSKKTPNRPGKRKRQQARASQGNAKRNRK